MFYSMVVCKCVAFEGQLSTLYSTPDGSVLSNVITSFEYMSTCHARLGYVLISTKRLRQLTKNVLNKAVDTVDYNILLSKFQCSGIRVLALDWITSYLAKLRQYVCYNNSNS